MKTIKFPKKKKTLNRLREFTAENILSIHLYNKHADHLQHPAAFKNLSYGVKGGSVKVCSHSLERKRESQN